MQIQNTTDIYCADSSRRLISLEESQLCPEDYIVYILCGIMLVLLIFLLTLAALYFRFKQSLKVWLYAKNLCLWWVTEEELDQDKEYDAFISFSNKDEDFVVKELVPGLENGPQPYKLLLHYRDWLAGEMITQQIATSVNNSKRTLIVLSPNFVESVWGKMEFRTAHTQAMSEGRTKVIVILLENVEIDVLDEELKTYLRTNTYLKWDDVYFWRKLRYALPHNKNT